MNTKLLALSTLLAGFSVVGCNKPVSAPKTDDRKAEVISKQEDDHDHGKGPHSGTIIEFGKYHAEFVVDHEKKQATVYILDGKKATKPEPIAVEKLLLSINAPRFQVDLLASPQEGDPKGASSRFVATHDNFGKEQEFEGTVSGEIGGKPYLGDFKEEAHTGHSHDKK